MTIREQLVRAQRAGVLTRITRSNVGECLVEGYIAACGPQFFAMEFVDDTQCFNGIRCMRYEDIEELKIPAPYSGFIETALALRGQERQGCHGVDLSSLATILRSAGDHFPLVTIHLIEEHDACYIGKVVGVDDHELELHDISPAAEWEEETDFYGLDEINQVDFGSRYEESLIMVAEHRS